MPRVKVVIFMINRREFLGAASAATALPPVARGAGDAATQPPNVIWLFRDQHRAQALGVAGDPNAPTPVIDNLAREGQHKAERRNLIVRPKQWIADRHQVPAAGGLHTSFRRGCGGPAPQDDEIKMTRL